MTRIFGVKKLLAGPIISTSNQLTDPPVGKTYGHCAVIHKYSTCFAKEGHSLTTVTMPPNPLTKPLLYINPLHPSAFPFSIGPSTPTPPRHHYHHIITYSSSFQFAPGASSGLLRAAARESIVLCLRLVLSPAQGFVAKLREQAVCSESGDSGEPGN